MTRVSNLFRLQTIDSQIDTQLSRLREIETWLADRGELDRLLAIRQDYTKKKENARLALLLSETETRQQQQKITSTDNTLYGGSVRNPKELQDLQQEAISLRKHLATLEDRQLKAMMEYEEAVNLEEQAVSQLGEMEQLRAREEKEKFRDRDVIQAAVEKALIQRESAVATIAEEDLANYQSLRLAKRGLAVVRLDAGVCTGCGVEPSTSRVDSTRSGQEIIPCGNCGRILYSG